MLYSVDKRTHKAGKAGLISLRWPLNYRFRTVCTTREASTLPLPEEPSNMDALFFISPHDI